MVFSTCQGASRILFVIDCLLSIETGLVKNRLRFGYIKVKGLVSELTHQGDKAMLCPSVIQALDR